MKVTDKRLGKQSLIGPRGGRKEVYIAVEVVNRSCLSRKCYAPMGHKGTYTQGRGYYGAQQGRFICGTRDAEGCPRAAIPNCRADIRSETGDSHREVCERCTMSCYVKFLP
jgi:hypothetical protein